MTVSVSVLSSQIDSSRSHVPLQLMPSVVLIIVGMPLNKGFRPVSGRPSAEVLGLVRVMLAPSISIVGVTGWENVVSIVFSDELMLAIAASSRSSPISTSSFNRLDGRGCGPGPLGDTPWDLDVPVRALAISAAALIPGLPEMVAVAIADEGAIVADPMPTSMLFGGAGFGNVAWEVAGADGVGLSNPRAVILIDNRSSGLLDKLPMGVRLGLLRGWEEKMYT